MARIAGVDLPREKRVEIGLTYIYGIGRVSSNKILERKSHDVKWLALRRGLSSGQSQESENNKMRSVYHRHHMNQWRLKSTWLVSQV